MLLLSSAVAKSGIIDNILNWAKFKQDQLLKKTDGNKRSRCALFPFSPPEFSTNAFSLPPSSLTTPSITGLVKLEDANNAGTKNGSKCTLILTEGDSAKALAVSGLAVVGRDNYGVFPLRGKLLNVREATGKTLLDNVEIQAIKKIMGLQQGKMYSSTESLRYGSLMIMADQVRSLFSSSLLFLVSLLRSSSLSVSPPPSPLLTLLTTAQDHDGSHIKGLIINFLDYWFPSLLKLKNFLVEFITPIVKVSKNKKEISFFTIPEYEEWKQETNDGRGWKIKYFKVRRVSLPLLPPLVPLVRSED